MGIGIIALADTLSRWETVKTAEVTRILGLEPSGPVRQSFEPPRVVIAVVDSAHPEHMRWSGPWLARAAHVILVNDVRSLANDQELTEIAVAIDPPPFAAEVVTWRHDADLANLVSRAKELDQPELETPVPVIPDRELPSGPWILYSERALMHTAQYVDQFDFELRAVAPGDFVRFARGERPVARIVNRDPVRPVRWTGHRMSLAWEFHDSYLDALQHDYPCGPAKKLYGYSNNDPVQVCMSPTLEGFLARFEHDVTFSTHIPMRWQRAGDLDVAVFLRDPRRAAFFARDPAHAYYDLAPEEEDARTEAPVMVLGPQLYAVDLRLQVWRVTRPADHPEPSPAGDFVKLSDPDQGYAVYTFDHVLVRRGTGRLLGGWYRHATLEDDGQYWREDLETGVRTRLGPIDLRRCADQEHEEVARDAILEGRVDDAARIRDSHPTETATVVGYLAIPGTRNMLIVTESSIRVI